MVKIVILVIFNSFFNYLVCDPKEKCNGNGICINDQCSCYSTREQGFYNPENNCLTCLNGYNGTQCKTPICTKGCGKGKCTSPDSCSCGPYLTGPTCEEETCYGISKKDRNVCSGRGFCIDFDTCICYTPYRGRDCSSLYVVSGVSIALQVIIGLASITVCIVLLSLLILLCKKVENPDKQEKVSWLELQNESEDE